MCVFSCELRNILGTFAHPARRLGELQSRAMRVDPICDLCCEGMHDLSARTRDGTQNIQRQHISGALPDWLDLEWNLWNILNSDFSSLFLKYYS